VLGYKGSYKCTWCLAVLLIFCCYYLCCFFKHVWVNKSINQSIDVRLYWLIDAPCLAAVPCIRIGMRRQLCDMDIGTHAFQFIPGQTVHCWPINYQIFKIGNEKQSTCNACRYVISAACCRCIYSSVRIMMNNQNNGHVPCFFRMFYSDTCYNSIRLNSLNSRGLWESVRRRHCICVTTVCGCLTFSPNGWEFLINFLHTYYTFLSTLDYKFLFNYFQLWRSYAILSATASNFFTFH